MTPSVAGNMQHHRYQPLSVNSVLGSSAGVRWHACLVQKAFPALHGSWHCTAASSTAVWVKPRHTITTQARLSPQEYWQAFDDYYWEDKDKSTRQLRASGIEPLTYSQQEGRYVNWWVEPPLMMDKKRCKTSAILRFLWNYHPDDLRALLDGRLESEYRCTTLSNTPCWEWHDETISLLDEYSIDHIIPASRGGLNHHANYFLMPRTVNNYFADSWTAEKIAYIGLIPALGAGGDDYGPCILR